MTDDSHLYEVDIQTAASPEELAAFCDLLEREGYHVATDLDYGMLRIHDGDETEVSGE